MCGLRATSIPKLPKTLLTGSEVPWIYGIVQILLDSSDCWMCAVVVFRLVASKKKKRFRITFRFEDVNNMLFFFLTFSINFKTVKFVVEEKSQPVLCEGRYSVNGGLPIAGSFHLLSALIGTINIPGVFFLCLYTVLREIQ